MKFFIDTAFDSLKKHGEELCGDMVEIIKLENSTIIVLADGLGSGVKANILSTLTSRIAGTMIKGGADISETVQTIINTLPVCKTRNLAYSTFTIIKIDDEGNTKIVEYENPPFFLIRNGQSIKMQRKEVIINDKKLMESDFKIMEDDMLAVVSDGVINAGIGNTLNMGWQWSDVESYLIRTSYLKKCAKNVSRDLIDDCWYLYGGKPGDDATAVGIKVKKPQYVDIFTGPPEDSKNDSYIISELMKGKGKKIICGGSSANIAERELNRKLTVDSECVNSSIPPTSTMYGIDLITEGAVTLNKAIQIIKNYANSFLQEGRQYELNGQDGASRLAKILIEECTHLTMWVGQAQNTAYMSGDFDIDIGLKLRLIQELCWVMNELGKIVKVNYI